MFDITADTSILVKCAGFVHLTQTLINYKIPITSHLIIFFMSNYIM